MLSGYEDVNACWEWRGTRLPRGYGQVRIPGRISPMLVHRRVWELIHGPIPIGMCVLHQCDNPPCFNPRHLRLGTIADNNHEMRLKSRARGGVFKGKRWWKTG